MGQVVTSTGEVAGVWTSPTPGVQDQPPALCSPALSDAVRAVLEPGTDPVEAQRRTRSLAGAHYENFSVVSLLLPRHLRQDFCNIYAFCRVADDLGDELDDPADSSAALGALRRQTFACREGQAETMLFTALGETLRRQ
jgi:hypothetical protein